MYATCLAACVKQICTGSCGSKIVPLLSRQTVNETTCYPSVFRLKGIGNACHITRTTRTYMKMVPLGTMTGCRHLHLQTVTYALDDGKSSVKPDHQRFQSASTPESQKQTSESENAMQESQKPTLWQRFKTMYKEYWYVLVPVHFVTSITWFGAFYYLAKSGIDIVPLLEHLGVSETILKPFRNTGAGYFAVAYAMYKVVTPARYALTLGCTTLAIGYLKRWGLVKPMPTTDQMKVLFQEKTRQLRSKRAQALAKMNLRRKATNKSAKESDRPEEQPK